MNEGEEEKKRMKTGKVPKKRTTKSICRIDFPGSLGLSLSSLCICICRHLSLATPELLDVLLRLISFEVGTPVLTQLPACVMMLSQRLATNPWVFWLSRA